jgi:hypothetical protein
MSHNGLRHPEPVLRWAMEIYLQNCRTRHYLKADGTWTPNLGDASRFDSAADATVYCAKHHVNEAQIFLHFGRKDLDMVIPVSQECRDGR